jgi:hypothetical protein
MKGKKVILSSVEQDWIVRNFADLTNAELCGKVGISESTLHRFARAHGLTKSGELMARTQANAAKAARASHIVHGTYPPKGYCIPGSERYQFQKGVTSAERLGESREAERVRRSTESRRKTWRLEHARMLFGLPRETKLKVVKHPHGDACRRHYLKRRGYLVERGSYDVYYTPYTRRCPRLEEVARPFRFYELTTEEVHG